MPGRHRGVGVSPVDWAGARSATTGRFHPLVPMIGDLRGPPPLVFACEQAVDASDGAGLPTGSARRNRSRPSTKVASAGSTSWSSSPSHVRSALTRRKSSRACSIRVEADRSADGREKRREAVLVGDHAAVSENLERIKTATSPAGVVGVVGHGRRDGGLPMRRSPRPRAPGLDVPEDLRRRRDGDRISRPCAGSGGRRSRPRRRGPSSRTQVRAIPSGTRLALLGTERASHARGSRETICGDT